MGEVELAVVVVADGTTEVEELVWRAAWRHPLVNGDLLHFRTGTPAEDQWHADPVLEMAVREPFASKNGE